MIIAEEGNMLLTFTLLVNFIGLVTALWLGLYLVTRNPRKPVAWISALALWSLSGDFLNILLSLNPPPELLDVPAILDQVMAFLEENRALGTKSWLEGWLVVPSIMLWHHTTMLLRPGRRTVWQVGQILFGYLISFSAIYLQMSTDLLLRADPSGDPLFINTLRAGTLYPFYFTLYVAYIGFSIWNLQIASRKVIHHAARKQLQALTLATLVAGLSIPLSFLGSLIGLRIPSVILSGILAITVLFIGAGVARYSALMEGRTIRRDFQFSALSVLGIVALYIFVSYLSVRFFGVAPGVFLFIILFAVITHSLLEQIRSRLDNFLFRKEVLQLRSKLLLLADWVGDRGGMQLQLKDALLEMCEMLHASSGLLLLFQGDEVESVARYGEISDPDKLTLQELSADDITDIDPNQQERWGEFTLLVPLYSEGRQLGALLLGQPVDAIHYSTVDLDRMLYLSDRLADSIGAANREFERLDQTISQLEVHRHIEPATKDLVAVETIELALRNLSDLAHLGDSELSKLKLVEVSMQPEEVTHLDRGKAVRDLLLNALEKLRPEEGDPKTTPNREWHSYLILHDAYVEDIPNRDIMSRLYISEGTFNRTRRAAVRAVARAVGEMETSLQA
jgi:hypothetical protein